MGGGVEGPRPKGGASLSAPPPSDALLPFEAPLPSPLNKADLHEGSWTLSGKKGTRGKNEEK